MLPLGIVGRTKFRAYGAFALLVINILVFVWELVLMARGQAVFMEAIATYAMNVCAVGVEPLPIISRNLIVSMFLHGSLAHLAGNMLFLWIFAPRVEAYLGHRRFIFFYLLMGVAAGAAHWLFGGIVCSPTQPYAGLAIGASGAIAGVMGAFLFLQPGARLETAFMVFRFRIPAFVYLLIFLALDVFKALDNNAATNVAYWAHIGGFVAGFVVAFVIGLFKPVPSADPFEHLD